MPKKIAYLISRFPSQYQSYVAREIVAMKRRGYGTRVFSLKKPGNIGHLDVEPLRDDTYYQPFVLSLGVWKSNLRLMIARPILYSALVWYIVRHNWYAPATCAKSLSVFPKAVHYAEVMKEQKICHIHAHWSTIPALCAIVCSRILDIAYSVTCHAVDIFEVTTMLEEKLSGAKFVVTCAGHNKQHLVQAYPGIEGGKIFVNYHGLDLEKVKRRKLTRSDRLEVVSVGRIEASKGYGYLLEACAKLKANGAKEFHCTIIGDGPGKADIVELIKRLDLQDCVTLTGAVPYETVIQYYEKASIAVLAAVSEFHRGIPNVIAEAMAMEIPVVVTPLPAIPELIEDGKNGIIIPEKNADALAEAIRRLMESEDLRTRLGREGRLTVEHLFDMRKTYAELSDIFERHM